MPRAAYKYVFGEFCCEVWHESLRPHLSLRLAIVYASGRIIGPGRRDHVQQKLAMRRRLLVVTGALRIVSRSCRGACDLWEAADTLGLSQTARRGSRSLHRPKSFRRFSTLWLFCQTQSHPESRSVQPDYAGSHQRNYHCLPLYRPVVVVVTDFRPASGLVVVSEPEARYSVDDCRTVYKRECFTHSLSPMSKLGRPSARKIA